MKLIIRLILIINLVLIAAGCQGSPTPLATRTPTPDPGIPIFDQFTITIIDPSDGPLIAQLAAEAQKAGILGRKPFIEFGVENCVPCKTIGDLLSDPMMQAAFENTYIIQVDVLGWMNQLFELNMPIDEWPSFYQIDSNGKPTGKFIKPEAWQSTYTVDMLAPTLFTFFQETQ